MFAGRGWSLIAVNLTVIAVMVLATRRLEPQVKRWVQGARGEEKAGARLDCLAGEG